MKSFLLVLLATPLFAYEVPKEVKAKYLSLYTTKVTQNADGSTSFGKARRFRRNGINVLYLEGDRFQMAFQHGRLLKSEIHDGALPEAAISLRNAILNNLGRIPVITELAIRLIYRQIPDRMYKAGLATQIQSSDRPLFEAYGLAEGADLPLDTVIYGALGPESLLVLLGTNLQKNPILNTLFPNFGRLLAPQLSPNSCSSFVADKSRTKDGNLLIARNTDYPLNGFYDRHPTVIYYNPTDGTQSYMAVTSAGLHNAGVVGYNASGIYLDVHTVPTTEVSRDGVPVFMIAQEVIRQSKSFDDAVTRFKNAKRPAAGWTYVLVSTKERKAATIEITNKGFGFRPWHSDMLVQTNHYLTPGMLKAEAHINYAVDQDTLARFQRIEELVNASKGSLDEKSAMQILADKVDVANGETRAFGNVVAVHTTMTSTVLSPNNGTLFVANGTAPVSQNEYIELPLGELNPDEFSKWASRTIPNDEFKKNFPKLAEAEQLFIQAKIAFESEIDYKKSIAYLEEALRLDPAAGYRFILGVLAFKAGDSDKAVRAFTEVAQGKDAHYRNLGNYYLGRIAANNAQKLLAKKFFQAVLDNADPKMEKQLITATENAQWTVNEDKHLPLKSSDLSLMMQQGDMIHY